jgi:hypothetical protein
MIKSPRVRALAIGVVALATYIAVYHEVLDRHLQGHGLVYLLGLAPAILLSGLYFAPQSKVAWLLWGAISPVLASAVGYAAVTMASYLQHGASGADLSLGSRALVALGFPYFACSVWTLSVALPLVGIANQYVRASTQSASSGSAS